MRHIEHEEQKKVFDWAKRQEKIYPDLKFLNSSQNGVKFRNALSAVRAKQTGLKRGFPDIFLPKSNNHYHGLFIELKTKENKLLNIKKGKVSVEQQMWIDYLNSQGYYAIIAYGGLEAIEIIKGYLNTA